jgi:hypothetical protein
MFSNVQELETLLTSALQVSASMGFEARPEVTFAIVDGVKCACPVAALAMMKSAMPGTLFKGANDIPLYYVLHCLETGSGLTPEQYQQLRHVAYGFDGGRARRGDVMDTPYTDLGRKLRPARVK